ncbi:MAG: efflux RND transporter periplasmic adaptor subunit [Thermodesulfobacteriota bacterium]
MVSFLLMDTSKRKKILAGIAVAAAIAAVAAYALRANDAEEAGTVRISGNVEVTRVEVSSRIPGRLVARFVDEGMEVALGQPVARLDASDLAREAAVREAELQAAAAFLRELLAGSRPQEIEAAKAALASARAEAARLEKDFLRNEELLRRELVARQQYDSAKAAIDVARSRVKEAEERLRLVEEGPRKEAIDQARARERQAREALELARTRLSYAEIVSPLKGLVLSKNVEPGDFVAAGTPIVTVGALDDVWLRGYIEETDLGAVKPGQPATVTVDSFPGKRYEGRVSFISPQAEFTPKTVQTRKERVKLVYRVKIDVPNPDRELLPGMPADAAIRIR